MAPLLTPVLLAIPGVNSAIALFMVIAMGVALMTLGARVSSALCTSVAGITAYYMTKKAAIRNQATPDDELSAKKSLLSTEQSEAPKDCLIATILILYAPEFICLLKPKEEEEDSPKTAVLPTAERK